jgi:hypothetical protein
VRNITIAGITVRTDRTDRTVCERFALWRRVNWETSVPLPKPFGNAAPNRLTYEILWSANSTLDEPVKEAILEAGKKR